MFNSFTRFCIIGGLMFFLDLSVLYGIMYKFSLPPHIARVISALCSVTISWMLHRSYTFGPSKFKALLEYRNYVISTVICFIINLSVYIILIKKFSICWQYPVIALIIATATSMNFSYFFLKKLVFIKKV